MSSEYNKDELEEMDIRPVEPVYKTTDSKQQSKNVIIPKDKTDPDSKVNKKDKTRIIDILV